MYVNWNILNNWYDQLLTVDKSIIYVTFCISYILTIMCFHPKYWFCLFYTVLQFIKVIFSVFLKELSCVSTLVPNHFQCVGCIQCFDFPWFNKTNILMSSIINVTDAFITNRTSHTSNLCSFQIRAISVDFGISRSAIFNKQIIS